MTKLKLGEKELQIKFGYEATVKSGIIKKIAGLEQKTDDFEVIDSMLFLLPELILVGAQKFHGDELGYNPANEDEKDEKMGVVYAMLDDYFDSDDSDVQALYNSLLSELLENGFLSKLLNAERKKTTKTK